MPDEKLKEVMEEIKALLAKHDVAGLVFLESKTHAEFMYKLDTTWSCIRNEDGVLRFVAKQADYPNKEAWRETVRLSAGILASLHDCCRVEQERLEGLLKHVAKHMTITHNSTEE